MGVAIVLIVVLAVALIAVAVATTLRSPGRRRVQEDDLASTSLDTEVLAPPPQAPPAEVPAPVEVEVADAPAPVVEEAPVVEAPPEPVAEPIVKARLRDRLGRTRSALAGYVRGIAGRRIEQSTWDDLEEALLLADVGLDTT